VGFFSFFSSTNVETKNVCPIAYNSRAGGRFNAACALLADELKKVCGLRKSLTITVGFCFS
jgi:hypothetical protein